MKISEMTNAQATEALIRLSGPFSEICDDDEALAVLEEYKARYHKPLFYTLGNILPRLITHLLVKHRNALFEIVSVITDVPAKDLDDMKLSDTIRLVQDNYDELLASFFTRSGAARRSAGSESA